MTKLLRLTDNNNTEVQMVFEFIGCGYWHSFRIESLNSSAPIWEWNGDMDNPTFSPSLLVNGNQENRCHLFVRSGQIEYLNDSYHNFRGQTVNMIDIGD